MELADLPGGDLIARGLDDLSHATETQAALLVAIGAPRLRRLGFDVPTIPEAEHRLYELLAEVDPDDAHSQYNALLRTLTSFERATECVA
jgi:hypothetical protein